MSDLPNGRLDVEHPGTRIPSGLAPVMDVWMRDPRVTPAGDGWYYLTGTTRLPDGSETNGGRWNDGVRLWRSRDLRKWEDLGLVWSLDREGGALARFAVYENGPGVWYEPDAFYREVHSRLPAPGQPGIRVRRSLWAPELHWLPQRGEFLISFCLNTNIAIPESQWVPPGIFGGNYFLRCSGKDPRGPWKLVSEEPMTDHIDGTILEEEDGGVWFIWQGGRMARFNDRLDGFDCVADPWQTPFHPEPVREGPFVVKRDGLYHLFLTVWSHEGHDGHPTYAHVGHENGRSFTYDLLQCSSTRLTGPYGPRHAVCIEGGHGHPFEDFEGNWWLACFGNPVSTAVGLFPMRERCRPYLVPMTWNDGRIEVDHSRR